jgi:Domain of unknown function (DUF4304)
MKSETSRLIDAIIGLGASPLLKSLGYRKLARSFHAGAGELIKVVHCQSSMWNTPDTAQFTLNLNIVLPYFHEKWAGKPFPKNPGTAAPIVSQRIGFLMPGNLDLWWQIAPSTDPAGVAAQVSSALSKYALPYLDHHSDLNLLMKDAASNPKKHPLGYNTALCLAILHNYRGNQSKAERIVRELWSRNKLESFQETIKLIAQRLDLELLPNEAR